MWLLPFYRWEMWGTDAFKHIDHTYVSGMVFLFSFFKELACGHVTFTASYTWEREEWFLDFSSDGLVYTLLLLTL